MIGSRGTRQVKLTSGLNKLVRKQVKKCSYIIGGKRRYIPICALFLLLGGCSSLDTVRAAIDRGVGIGAGAVDAYMAGLDKARAELQTEIERIEAAYCNGTLGGIRRYAEKSVENRQRIAKNCGLIVVIDTLTRLEVGPIE